jgi:hypothetical protein
MWAPPARVLPPYKSAFVVHLECFLHKVLTSSNFDISHERPSILRLVANYEACSHRAL